MRGGSSWDLQEAGEDPPRPQMVEVEVEVLWVGREAQRGQFRAEAQLWDAGSLSVLLLQKVFKSGSVPGRVEF